LFRFAGSAAFTLWLFGDRLGFRLFADQARLALRHMENDLSVHLQYLPFFMLTPAVLRWRGIFFDPVFLALLA
jgi:hypothetical protein